MSIKRRGNVYQANVYQGAGAKRATKTFPSWREAKDWETEMLEQRRLPDGATRVSAFAETWLVQYPRPKRSTTVHYEQSIKGFVKEFGGEQMRALSRVQMRRWAITHPAAVGAARAMLGDAQRDGLIASNPLAGMRLPSSRGRRDIEALTQAEVQQLVEAAHTVHAEYGKNVYAPMILIAAYAGLRPGELHGLRWDDIREDHLRVERQYSPKASAFTTPKNGKARIVPLLAPAKMALEDIPRTERREVFVTKNGKHFSGKVSHYYWHPVRSAFGRPEMSFYELRHYFGSMLARMGVGAPDIARVMGHTDGGKLALERYIHTTESESLERIHQAFAQPAPLRVVSGGGES